MTESRNNVFTNTFLLSLLFLLRRVRDKYESELKELEESERNMQEKYNNMKVNERSVAAVISSIT